MLMKMPMQFRRLLLFTVLADSVQLAKVADDEREVGYPEVRPDVGDELVQFRLVAVGTFIVSSFFRSM